MSYDRVNALFDELCEQQREHFKILMTAIRSWQDAEQEKLRLIAELAERITALEAGQ